MPLENMKNVDLRTIDTADLVDIKNISVNKELSKDERIKEFVRQIKNPYCFKCGKFVVKAVFADNGIPLEERLLSIIS